MHLSRLPEAGARLDEALAIARAQGDDALACRILGVRAFVWPPRGRRRDGCGAGERGPRGRLRTGWTIPRWLGTSLARLADAYDLLTMIDFPRTRRLLEDALEIAPPEPTTNCCSRWSSTTRARPPDYVGEFDLARERLEECVALCRGSRRRAPRGLRKKAQPRHSPAPSRRGRRRGLPAGSRRATAGRAHRITAQDRVRDSHPSRGGLARPATPPEPRSFTA